MSYQNILFDMGNVLIDFSPDHLLSQYTLDLKLINELKHKIFFSKYWHLADQGLLNKQELLENICLNIDQSKHSLVKDIVDTWYLNKSKMQNSAMLELVQDLKNKGYKLYLCSNVAESFYDFCDQIEVFKYFDGKVISADIKLCKPDYQYYEYVLKKYDLKASQCFFIDDSMKNIQAAYELGIDGYWYNGNAKLLREFLTVTKIL